LRRIRVAISLSSVGGNIAAELLTSPHLPLWAAALTMPLAALAYAGAVFAQSLDPT